MKAATIGRIHRVTVLVAFTSVVFWQFFDITKHGPFRDINPFGDDPYDAVGSFAFQVALLVGILTYARALRLREVASPAAHARLILRGNIVVLAAILVTLVADAIAEIIRPLPPSYWGNILLAALVLMFLLALFCV